ncbi:MAG: hypothetical protein QME49_05435 [bacterium]|nr:hypothetical protein [bacterium]
MRNECPANKAGRRLKPATTKLGGTDILVCGMWLTHQAVREALSCHYYTTVTRAPVTSHQAVREAFSCPYYTTIDG